MAIIGIVQCSTPMVRRGMATCDAAAGDVDASDAATWRPTRGDAAGRRRGDKGPRNVEGGGGGSNEGGWEAAEASARRGRHRCPHPPWAAFPSQTGPDFCA
jgi:hypothetical protein